MELSQDLAGCLPPLPTEPPAQATRGPRKAAAHNSTRNMHSVLPKGLTLHPWTRTKTEAAQGAGAASGRTDGTGSEQGAEDEGWEESALPQNSAYVEP